MLMIMISITTIITQDFAYNVYIASIFSMRYFRLTRTCSDKSIL